jgi:microcystin-dependent protein
MPILDFPITPADGTLYKGYKYVASNDTWLPPSTLELRHVGDIVNDTVQNSDKLVYNASSSKWATSSNTNLYPGQIFAFAGSTAPDGFLLCEGAQVSQTTYSALYAAISTSYNLGTETSGYFRLPNLAGRVPIGKDSSDTNIDTLGEVYGERVVTLSTSQIPSHTHIQDAHTHTANAHNHTQDSHNHGVTIPFYPSGWEAGGYGTGYYGAFRDRTVIGYGGWGMGSDGRQPYIYGTTATNNANTATNQNAGGGGGHNNLQPYIVLKYIIKT